MAFTKLVRCPEFNLMSRHKLCRQALAGATIYYGSLIMKAELAELDLIDIDRALLAAAVSRPYHRPTPLSHSLSLSEILQCDGAGQILQNERWRSDEREIIWRFHGRHSLTANWPSINSQCWHLTTWRAIFQCLETKIWTFRSTLGNRIVSEIIHTEVGIILCFILFIII